MGVHIGRWKSQEQQVNILQINLKAEINPQLYTFDLWDVGGNWTFTGLFKKTREFVFNKGKGFL